MLKLDLSEKVYWSIFRNDMVPRLLSNVKPEDDVSIVREKARELGLSKVQSWRLVSALVRSGLEDFNMHESIFHLNYYDHRIERIFRVHAMRKVLRLLSEDGAQRLREMSRALRVSVTTVDRAVRILETAGIIEKCGKKFSIADNLIFDPTERIQLIPQRKFAESFRDLPPKIEKNIGLEHLHAFLLSGPYANGTATANNKPTFIAIARSTEPKNVTVMTENICRVLGDMKAESIVICTGEVWLDQLLCVSKHRHILLERGYSGIPLYGQKPQRRDLLDVMQEVLPMKPEKITSWKKKRYLEEVDGRLCVTSRGLRTFRVMKPLFVQRNEASIDIEDKTFHLIYG